jgi:membrane associated rhomboid family serine protease
MKPIITSTLWANSPVCCILMVTILVTSLCSIFYQTVLLRLFFHPYSIVFNKEYFRLISGDLVHNDLIHLLINEIILLTFCSSLESYLNLKTIHGDLFFLAIYFGSCLAGTIPTTIRYYTDINYSSAGASGSIMGCLFGYIILQPNETAYFLPIIGPVSNMFGGLIFLAGLIFYKWRSKNQLINHEVHFYGAIGGIIMTLIIVPGVI